MILGGAEGTLVDKVIQLHERKAPWRLSIHLVVLCNDTSIKDEATHKHYQGEAQAHGFRSHTLLLNPIFLVLALSW